MAVDQTAASSLQLLAQRARRVARFIAAARLQFGHDEFSEVFVGFGRDCIAQIKAIDVGLIHPFLKRIGHFVGRANEDRSASADGVMQSQFAHRPDTLRI